jgi:hypothetical protein
VKTNHVPPARSSRWQGQELSKKKHPLHPHPESRQLQLEHLRELYAKAKVIESTVADQFDDQAKGLLAHITSRSFDGHVAIARGSEVIKQSV